MSQKPKLILTTLLFTVFSMGAFAQSDNPFIGTWDIDLDRSEFGSGNVPQTMSRTYFDHEDGSYTYIVVTTNTSGIVSATSAHYTYGGEKHPIASFNQNATAQISYNRINDTTVEYTVWAGEDPTQIGAKFISPNYQQLTIAIQFPGSDQQDQVLVFNKRAN